MHLPLITPQPVLGFYDDGINYAVFGNLKEPDIGGALVDRSSYFLIGMNVVIKDVTCKSRGGLPAEGHLVVERAHVLALTRIPA
jgi:hypothetical protein